MNFYKRDELEQRREIDVTFWLLGYVVIRVRLGVLLKYSESLVMLIRLCHCSGDFLSFFLSLASGIAIIGEQINRLSCNLCGDV